MRVFKVNECDWVCAKNEKEVKEWYLKETGLDEEEAFDNSAYKEANIYKEGMWESFENFDNLIKFLKEKRKIYKIDYDFVNGYGVVLWLTFKEVIDLNNIIEPCLIASTEY